MKKIISVLIATVLIMAGVTVVANSIAAQEPRYIETITLEVRTTQETGLGDTAVGDIDVFIQSVPGELFDGISDEWKARLGTWASSGSYNNFILNPAFDKETQDEYPETEMTMIGGGLPVINVAGEWQFNPMADRHIRFAQNFMIDRTDYLEDLYGGYGSERYLAMGQEEPGFEEFYRPIVERLEIDQDGDFSRAFDMIQERMNYWADHDGIEEWTGRSLENTGTDADPVWEFGGDQIELTSANRIEDERLSIGHDWSDKMEDMGFAVNRFDGEAAMLFGMTLFADASDMDWHMYTGGWIASAANVFQQAAMNQMYLAWYGWQIGMIDGTWQFDDIQDPDIEQKGRDLLGGRAPDMETYWQWMMDIAEYGMEESVRIFLVTTYDFFCYDADRVAEAATDVVTGWAGIYSPRTLKIRDPDGAFKVAQYSSVGALYMDNWNRIDGSGDTYSMQQQDMARDFTMYNHPAEGMPIGIRTDYEYQEDYVWDGADLVRNLDVPSGAIDYDVQNREWVEVGDGLNAATAVTFNFYETGDGDLGKYHDGNPINYRDLLGWYAFSKSLTYEVDDDERYFYGPWASVQVEFYDNIQGIEIHEEGGEITSYTVYGNYAFPDERSVASYYSITSFKPWQVYEAARIMVNQHEDEEHLWGGVDRAGQTWSWAAGRDNWIHFISSAQGETFKQVMENMIEHDWVPEYFETMANGHGDVDVSTELQRTIDFFDNHGHMFISQGPFRIIEIDEPNMVMEMERWRYADNNYPLPKDHWEDRLVIRRFEIRDVLMPSRIRAGEDIDVEVRARMREEYPRSRTYDADEGEVTVIIIVPDDDNIIETVDAPIEAGRFLLQIPGEMTEDLDGSYEVAIEGTAVGVLRPARETRSLLVIEDVDDEAEFRVTNFNVDPIDGEAPLDVTVTANIENIGDVAGTIELTVDGDTEADWTLEPGESISIDETITFEDGGSYEIRLGNRRQNIEVSEETPGFTLAILAISAILAVVIYYKKKTDE